MSDTAEKRIEKLVERVQKHHPDQPEFHQAVAGVARSVMPLVIENHAYSDCKVLEQLTEPDRIISFRVAWRDDKGEVHVNRGWRVQHNHAIGPYKGGLRFAPSVNESVLKFLAFEQTFKNSLTNLPMGGAKGGSNFDPHGRSNGEIMRFCQSFMECLYRYIGPKTDVPAGDMGVGSREIGYLFGHFIRLTNTFEGSLTGKGLSFGGSAERAERAEATGYGLIYFLKDVLEHHDLALENQTVTISGAGNVALHAAEKAIEEGAKVITLSDSRGLLKTPKGLKKDALETIKRCKLHDHGALKDVADDIKGAQYHAEKTPWGVECDIALPCATQNELDEDAAKTLVKNGLEAVVEGANMPCTDKARACFAENDVIFGPGKAANAGGVAVSGLEISQNAVGVQWEREEVDKRLRAIMSDIHDKCRENCPGKDSKPLNYVAGADIAGFRRVADAIVSYGVG